MSIGPDLLLMIEAFKEKSLSTQIGSLKQFSFENP